MPIPGGGLEAEMLARGEVALVRADQADREEDGADQDVETVEAGRHEEGGAIVDPLEGEGRVHVFIRLDAAEQHAERNRQPQPLEHAVAVADAEQAPQAGLFAAALVVDQRVVRPGDGGAAGEQDQRVEQGEFEGVDDLQPLGRPLRGDRGGALGSAFDLSVDDAHRGREQAEVEERPEPADEEHDFGGDEQDHAVAEVKLHDRGVIAVMRLAHHVGPPAIHREQYAREAGEENPAAAVGLVRGEVAAVHPHDRAGRHHQRRQRSEQRPDAGGQDVVIVVLGASHVVSLFLSSYPTL
eukprot:TRINITY_DN15393_c0_g1_i1.p1 TRINITY_DN15393_c0_g1~~TRINITY_DN15393_c0_g1_i1.p1  ORF type:complete len:297 (+),score=-1.57 TRINITY_DN15393_c0_g1_i1:1-891(+)